MNDAHHLLRKLLQIDEPWVVTQSQLDVARRRQDVWISLELPRGWFGLGRAKAPPSMSTSSWRHVNFGDWAVFLHVVAPPGADLSHQPWTGEIDLPFSRALSRQVFAYLREGCSLQSICTLLRLPIGDLWRFRYALDSGRWSADGMASRGEVADAGALPFGEMSPPQHDDADVPELTDPVWHALLDGSQPIDIRALGLRLLLTRLRAQYELIADTEVRRLKLHECRRYFVKNKHLLAHELAQLRGGRAGTSEQNHV